MVILFYNRQHLPRQHCFFFLSYMKPDKKYTKQYSSNKHINDIKTYITRGSEETKTCL